MNLKDQAKYISENFSEKLDSCEIKDDNLIIHVDKKNLLTLLKFLKSNQELSFKILLDIFGVDMLAKRSPRFEILYHLLSLKLNNRIVIKVLVDENISVPSSCEVFINSNWYEREIFDMFGIKFDNHPDLRRILTDYGFEGYPLRKDFPLTGYKEVRYDEKQKKVIYEDVNLSQEYRNFDFETPWQGENYNLPGDEKAS